jgi:hypothetical protein
MPYVWMRPVYSDQVVSNSAVIQKRGSRRRERKGPQTITCFLEPDFWTGIVSENSVIWRKSAGGGERQPLSGQVAFTGSA